MSQKAIHTEIELAAFAKKVRVAAKKNRAQAARELGVARPTVFQAEENPELSLSKLRKRIIEQYSSYTVVGPVYLLKKR